MMKNRGDKMRNHFVNFLWFVCSIMLNALGNSFMITSHLGSSPWTAAGQNLGSILPFSIGTCIIILNLFSFILSYLMKTKFTLIMIAKSMGLTFIYGMFVDMFVSLHEAVYVPDDIWIRCLYSLIGLNFIAIAISIYFQASSIYLPSDYLLKSFGELMNNYKIGTIVCMLIPLSTSVVIILLQHHVIGLGISTLLFVFGSGFLIDYYNRWIVLNKYKKPNINSA